jgi:hypothetical protein
MNVRDPSRIEGELRDPSGSVAFKIQPIPDRVELVSAERSERGRLLISSLKRQFSAIHEQGQGWLD